MSLTKPNQQLCRELKELGIGLEQAAGEILTITKDCKDIDVVAVLKVIAKLYDDADRIAALADEVSSEEISRSPPE
ncbi:hypothetical protein ACOI7N_20805 [Pseudomonas sp. P2758]|uniref:hypothetical protein n=1 Tax=Pseudomonas sp. P2758 TaxID=3409916 RepID=UPI003B596D00